GAARLRRQGHRQRRRQPVPVRDGRRSRCRHAGSRAAVRQRSTSATAVSGARILHFLAPFGPRAAVCPFVLLPHPPELPPMRPTTVALSLTLATAAAAQCPYYS